MKKFFTFIIISGSLILSSACEKMLETDLQGSDLTEAEALQSKQDVLDLLQSCYDVTANVYNGRIQYLNELLGDNLSDPTINEDLSEVYNHNTLFFNGTIGGIFQDPYITIFRANRVLEVIEDFNFSATEKEEIAAQARFLRALSHWEMLKLFCQPSGFTENNSHAGLIYKISTEEQITARESVASNYASIIADFEAALPHLVPSSNYYASQDAVNAYLSKIYFQKGDYALAVQYADAVINSGRYSLGTSIDRFELDTVNVSEAIFTTTSNSTLRDFRSTGFTDNYRSDLDGADPLFKANKDFYDVYAADTSDKRIKDFFELVGEDANAIVLIKKFNQEFFDIPVFHITDLKLLRAEALALSGGDLSIAIQDINDVKRRAYGSSANDLGSGAGTTEVKEAARYERRIEMFGEGDRMQQLKRRGAIGGELIEVRNNPWDCNGMIIQFPISEQTSAFDLNPTGGC
jgi:tetratricopeptide (TPR) repeat protein